MSKKTPLDKLIENILKNKSSKHIIIIPNNISKKFILGIISSKEIKNIKVFYLDDYIFSINKENKNILMNNDFIYLESILDSTTSVFNENNLTLEVENIITIINNLLLEKNIYIDEKNFNEETIIKKISQNLLSYESKIFLEILKIWISRSKESETYINKYIFFLNKKDTILSKYNYHIVQSSEYSELEKNWIKKNLQKLSCYEYKLNANTHKNDHALKNSLIYESYDFRSQEEELAHIAKDIIKLYETDKNIRICIINNNRYFTRRLAAILNRNKIKLNDNAGWVLSTSSCCSYISNILDYYIKNDNYINLHDIVMSPYYMPKISHEIKHKFLNNILISQKGNINSSINIDTKDINNDHTSKLYSSINNNNNNFNDQCAFDDFKKFILYKISDFGSENIIRKDLAGKVLLKSLDDMSNINHTSSKKKSFSAWQEKLLSYLDTKTFSINNSGNIYYTDINNALLCSFDKIYINSMSNKNFPKKNINNFSINNIIYSDFSLNSSIRDMENIESFLNLSNNTNNILLTFSSSDGDEYFAKSKFKTYVDHFIKNKEIKNSFKNNFTKNTLKKYSFVLNEKFKILNYRDVQNYNFCFYCFYFNKSSPKVKSISRISENYFQFGNYVHSVLFKLVSSDVKFNNYEDIIKKLNYFTDLEEKNFFLESESPYKINLWRKLLPKIANYYFLDNSKKYNFFAEKNLTLNYKDTLILRGRCDLMYSCGNDNCLVDYKTTPVLPSRKSVLLGEDLQLSFYTLLDKNVSLVEYLSINASTNTIKSVKFKSTELENARSLILNTLENIYLNIVNKTTLNVEKSTLGCKICGFIDTNR